MGTTPTGVAVALLIVCYLGSPDAGEQLLRPVRALGNGLINTIAERPYWEFNRSVDDRHPHGLRYFWKTNLAPTVSEAATDAALEYFTRTPSPLGILTIEHYGGAVARIGAEETAFAQRQGACNYVAYAKWTDPAEDDARIGWARGMWRTVAPYAPDAVYMNMLGSEDGADRVRAAYGRNYGRLAAIKARYDPNNFFRRNQNIAPAASTRRAQSPPQRTGDATQRPARQRRA